MSTDMKKGNEELSTYKYNMAANMAAQEKTEHYSSELKQYLRQGGKMYVFDEYKILNGKLRYDFIRETQSGLIEGGEVKVTSTDLKNFKNTYLFFSDRDSDIVEMDKNLKADKHFRIVSNGHPFLFKLLLKNNNQKQVIKKYNLYEFFVNKMILAIPTELVPEAMEMLNDTNIGIYDMDEKEYIKKPKKTKIIYDEIDIKNEAYRRYKFL